jgi:hypothetical protein
MDTWAIIKHGAVYGGILSVVLGGLVIGSLAWNNEIWWSDYPADVKARFGPMSEKAKRQRVLVVIPFFAALIAIVALSLVGLREVIGGELAFFPSLLSTYVVLIIFNLVDLLIIDWLILMALRPRFAFLPGTADLPGYRDYTLPFKGFLKGTAGLLVLSVPVAALAVLIDRAIG